jgi:hypothetical protein
LLSQQHLLAGCLDMPGTVSGGFPERASGRLLELLAFGGLREIHCRKIKKGL